MENSCLTNSEEQFEEEDASTSATRNNWSKNVILKLIQLYKENDHLFKSTTVRNEKVWEQISKQLGTHTAEQCKNKFKYLKSKYVKKKDNMSNKSTGSQVFNFSYFEEMDELFKNDPNITPVSIASTLKPYEVENVEATSEEAENEEQSVDEKKSKQGKKRKHSELFGLLHRLETKAEQREKARQERHEAIMQQREEAKCEFKGILSELISKLNK